MVKLLQNMELRIKQEPDIKRWTAKRKAELIRQIYHGYTTAPEAARHYDLTQQEVEKWMKDAVAMSLQRRATT